MSIYRENAFIKWILIDTMYEKVIGSANTHWGSFISDEAYPGSSEGGHAHDSHWFQI